MKKNYKILGRYIKDMSSETPNIETYIFVRDHISKYQLGIDINSRALKDKVIEIIAEKALLKPIEIELDSTINDLGLDSLGIVETVFALEEHFEIDIDINFNKIEDSKFDISTVRKIIISVEKLIISKTDELE